MGQTQFRGFRRNQRHELGSHFPKGDWPAERRVSASGVFRKADVTSQE